MHVCMLANQAWLTPVLLAPAAMPGMLHSSFRTAVNLRITPTPGKVRLLTLLPDHYPAVPDSLTLKPADLELVRRQPIGTQLTKEKGRIRIGKTNDLELFLPESINRFAWLRPVKATCDWRDAIRAFPDYLPDFANEHGLAHLPAADQNQVAGQLHRFARALLRGDTARASAALCRVVGLGRGLTPAADDRLVSIMGLTGLIRQQLGQVPIGLAMEDLLPGRTTDVSSKYLVCADEGYYPSSLTALWQAILENTCREWPAVIQAVAAIGGTSGRDYLAGTAIACWETTAFLSAVKEQNHAIC